ncbi:helix-turn-helix domain containing protein [Gordonia amicalis]|uniref:Helix-turn-helix domain-containing protein n=2 Tax=Gordoniaceae TaxID=85026 RepID=A0AAE4R7Y2_9ACTN|nr:MULTISPECIES: TetR/AcrR family transcriptional regulator [Gordonia]MCZ4581039.1 helix-turn-helix domain containing protein [Gordonia amicalis]MDJ0454867.1 helix-turn-helix domain-containing protein [Gordonia amicalis]MDV6314151.1 helix-turn-helix domain-containing protein [Gordonia amicalis]MDV7078143.1 helix-turn-helix domain-containing protein [Gordonia amicalis]MDV7175936.1 helix-turn-helix domain-containing protein [Gordonia amicalis]
MMVERDYDRISVRDILDRADTGRSAFYAHFRDKDDLLLASSVEYLRDVLAVPLPPDPAAPPDSERLAPVPRLLVLAQQYPEVYRVLVGRSTGGTVLRSMRDVVERLLTEQMAGRLEVAEQDFAATIAFLSWGVVGMQAAIADSGGALTARRAYDIVAGLLSPAEP